MKTQQLFLMVFICLTLPLVANYCDTIDCSSYENELSFYADSVFDRIKLGDFVFYVQDSGKPAQHIAHASGMEYNTTIGRMR